VNTSRSFRRWIARYFAGFGTALLLGGCAPVVEPYRFIPLEGYEYARIRERVPGTPGGGSGWFVGDLPTQYRIDRDSYTLRLEIDPSGMGPAIGFIVSPVASRKIATTPGESPGCPGWTHPFIGPLTWVHRFGCETIDQPPSPRIRFRVTDQDGNTIAEEMIPYTVKWNGFYVYFDGV